MANKVIFQRKKDKNYVEAYANDLNLRKGNDGTTRITFFEEYIPPHDFEEYERDEHGNINYNEYRGFFKEFEDDNNETLIVNRNEKVTLTLNENTIIKLYNHLKNIIE